MMEPIRYWYPVVYLDEDDPEDTLVVRKQGRILPFRLDREPYEADVEACGSCFHLLFGTQVNGMFLCIPDWHVGCELSDLSDRSWNLDSLLKADRLDYEESTAVVWALSNIGTLFRFLH